MAFKATISSQLGIQSHHCFSVTTFRVIFLSFGVQSHQLLITRCLRPSSFLSYDIQSHPSQFDIQGYQFLVWHSEPPYLLSLVFKAMFLVWCSESLSLHGLTFKAIILSRSGIRRHLSNVQSHHFFSVWCLEPFFQFGIQSHCLFLVRHSELSCLFSDWYLEPPSFLSYDVHNHHLFLFWHSEPLSLLIFGAQSYNLFSIWVFRAIISLQLGVQSCPIFLVTTFRVIMSFFS